MPLNTLVIRLFHHQANQLFNLVNYLIIIVNKPRIFYLKCRGEDPRFYRWDETPTSIETAKHD
jgi:hypothetical protein